MSKKKKYTITFIKWNGKTWYMVCTRSYCSCLKIASRHFIKGHCIAFIITKNYNL